MGCNKKLIIWFSGGYSSSVKDGNSRLIAECNSNAEDCGFAIDLVGVSGLPKTDRKSWDITDDVVLQATIAHLEHIKQQDEPR